MIDTPVWVSPAMIARSTGAAPRQRGSSEGWTFNSSCSDRRGSLMRAPNAHTTTVWRAPPAAIIARAAGSLTLRGCATGIPSERARSATGGEASRRPRPRGRSGRVSTSVGRWASLPARRSRTAAANSEVPRKTVLKSPTPPGRPLGDGRRPVLGRFLGLAHRAHRLLARLAGDAIQDQHAIEVVHLVLDHPGSQPVGLDLELTPARVARAHSHARRALDLDVHAGQAQAPLFGELALLALPHPDRVDEGRQLVLRVGPVDEHAVQHSELGRGQPDAERVVHQIAHALDLRLQRLIEALDGERAGAQHRVSQLAHLAQRGIAPRARLGIELVGSGRVLL